MPAGSALPPYLPIIETSDLQPERAGSDYCARLHDACRRCATIEFRYEGREPDRCRREQVAPLLEQILASNEWYVPRSSEPASGMRQLTITFLDAEGKDILSLDAIPCRRRPMGEARDESERREAGYWYDPLWNLFADELGRARHALRCAELRRIAATMKEDIPLFFRNNLEDRDISPYGRYDAPPQFIGHLTPDDLRALAASPLIPDDGCDTLDYWYSLDWKLPEGSPDIGISLCPAETLGIELTGCHVRNDALHAKISTMIADWYRRHGFEVDEYGNPRLELDDESDTDD